MLLNPNQVLRERGVSYAAAAAAAADVVAVLQDCECNDIFSFC